jgi:hypothetical protein
LLADPATSVGLHDAVQGVIGAGTLDQLCDRRRMAVAIPVGALLPALFPDNAAASSTPVAAFTLRSHPVRSANQRAAHSIA